MCAESHCLASCRPEIWTACLACFWTSALVRAVAALRLLQLRLTDWLPPELSALLFVVHALLSFWQTLRSHEHASALLRFVHQLPLAANL